MKSAIYLALLMALLYVPGVDAQKTVQFQFDPKTDMLFDEIGVMLHQESNIVKVTQVMPEGMRPKENKDVVLKEGDIVAMANGRKIKEISAFRKLYDALKIGDELKLGVKRDGEAIIISVHKTDPEKRGGPRMMKMTMDGKNSDAIPGVGFVETSGNSVVVKAVFDPESISAKNFKPKDVLRSLNGKPITTMHDLKSMYDKIPTGGKAEFAVTRDGREVTVSIDKPDQGKMQIMQRKKP